MPIKTGIPTPTHGDTFQAYWGEFLVVPEPLELSFAWCTHACAYCFSNINKPGRWADIGATMRLLSECQTRTTIEARLLAAGYPTIVSNRVDPFAVSNDRQSLPVLELMAATGKPVMFQTRGGRHALSLAANYPKSCWYLSICSLDDAVRKRVEPGAPTIESRFELATKLREMGHHVDIAVNPHHPAWVPDPAEMVRRIVETGAEGIVVSSPHLSARQMERLTDKEKAALGPEFLNAAQDTKGTKASRPHDVLLSLARDAGLHVNTHDNHLPSRVYDRRHATYARTFPTAQGWVNHCHERWPDGGAVSLFDWMDYLVPQFPAGDTWPIHHYIASGSKDVLRDKPMKPRGSYADLMAFGWQDYRTSFHPVRSPSFAYAGMRERPGKSGKAFTQLTDDDGNPILIFDPKGEMTAYFVDVTGEGFESFWADSQSGRWKTRRVA